MTIATLSRAARHSRGNSQTDIAARAGLPASTLSFIENGRRIPRVDTLDGILRHSGARLIIAPTTRATTLEVAVEIERLLRAGDTRQAFRTWLAHSDDLAAETATNRVVITAFAPNSTGDELYDAALAALVAHRLTEVGAPLPHWTSTSPVLDEPRMLTDSRFVTAAALGPIPDEFTRRGVLIDADSLRSV